MGRIPATDPNRPSLIVASDQQIAGRRSFNGLPRTMLCKTARRRESALPYIFGREGDLYHLASAFICPRST